MIRLLPLAVLALAVVACSDRVPAPVTPTPSPRPGYPPAPVSELPEGVLYVSKQDVLAPPLFRFEAGREAEKIGAMVLGPVSPDGSRAVAVTYGDRGVVLEIGILTGERYEPMVQGEAVLSSPMFVWSNDGRHLAYTIPRDPASTQVEARSFDAETGEKRLLSPEPGDRWLVGWRASGDLLAVQMEGIELLAEGRRTIPLPEPGMVVDAVISPDGRALAIKLGQYEQDAETELTYIHSGGIWVLGLVGEAWREVTDLDGRPPEAQTRGGQKLQWSPDGSRISAHTTRMAGGVVAEGLGVFDARTGEETRVHDQGWGWESWSPDGRYLAYMYYGTKSSSASEPRLGLLGPDGETREVDANVRYMAWTKDGRLLVDIPARLSLLDPETMELEEVLTGEGETISAFVESSVWSPSGRYVALSTPSDALHRSSLYIVDTETGQANLFLDEAGFWARAWLRE